MSSRHSYDLASCGVNFQSYARDVHLAICLDVLLSDWTSVQLNPAYCLLPTAYCLLPTAYCLGEEILDGSYHQGGHVGAFQSRHHPQLAVHIHRYQAV